MAYKPYADEDYYEDVYEGTLLSGDDIEKYLKQASRHIDSLTFNRIVQRGIKNLTEFQQDIIKEVCCQQAEFEFQNKDIFDMVLSGYSINGVSMQFGESWNVTVNNGVPMKRDTYNILLQTGLCRNTFGW